MNQYIITIAGQGGHGSRPDLSINPIDSFAAIHSALRQLEGYEVQNVDGGTSGNIIPNTVVLYCTCNASRELVQQIVDNTCRLYHCTATIEA